MYFRFSLWSFVIQQSDLNLFVYNKTTAALLNVNLKINDHRAIRQVPHIQITSSQPGSWCDHHRFTRQKHLPDCLAYYNLHSLFARKLEKGAPEKLFNLPNKIFQLISCQI